jgi:hypothetical protein
MCGMLAVEMEVLVVAKFGLWWCMLVVVGKDLGSR